jgi:hypothetical protein
VKGVIAIDIDKVIIKGKNTQKIKKKKLSRDKYSKRTIYSLSISFPF